jgi:hypothetical protein
MLHGRECSTMMVRVNTPIGRAPGPPTGLIGRVSRGSARRADAAHVSRTSTTPRQIWLRRHDLAAPIPWIPPSSPFDR